MSARDLRIIADTVKSYWIDNNAYPVLAGGPTGVQALQPLLEPLYVRGLPLKDGWDRGYLYWSNGEDFLVYSTGGDGEDQPYSSLLEAAERVGDQLEAICGGESEHLGTDVVFANGKPCRWPEGAFPE